jgi:hypothetical protein
MSHQQPYGAPYGPGPYTQVEVTPYRSSTAHLVIAWVVAVLTALYMLPWAVAATRNRSNTAAIALINLFLGWSVVGWVVALVMACGSEPAPVVHVTTGYPPPSVWPGPPPSNGGYGYRSAPYGYPTQGQLPPAASDSGDDHYR